MDFQNEYDSATSTINDVLSTQLSSVLQWTGVPGSLTKASSSPAGFVWGYNSSNIVYKCQLPCSGDWQPVDLSAYTVSTVQDITTDSANVYILITSGANTVLLVGPANGQGNMNMIAVPFSATSIFSTNTYIWAQDKSNNKQKCPKPCTSPNWIAVPENKVTITSASTDSLYGKDGSGNAMRTDENLQSGWTAISGLSKLKLKSVIGQADQTALYGIDNSNLAYRCEGDCSDPSEVDPLETGGYMPLNLSADATSKKLWMTSTTSGDKGNVFSKFDNADYGTIMNDLTPLDQTRDKVVQDVTHEYQQQTNLMIANKQISEIVQFFKDKFKFDSGSVKQTQIDTSRYQDKIKETSAELDQINSTQPIIQILLLTLVAVVILYSIGWFLGELIHAFALLVLAGGLVYAIYYSSN